MYIREEVYFINSNLDYVVLFSITKSDDKVEIVRYYPRNYDPNFVMYARPYGYVWEECSIEGKPMLCLKFPEYHSFSILQKDTASLYVRRFYELDASERDLVRRNIHNLRDSSYVFTVEIRSLNRKYREISVAMVFPSNLRVLGYTSTVPAKWKRVKNTFAFYAMDVAKARIFVIFELIQDTLYRELVKLAKETKERYIEVERVKRGVRIRLGENVLFESGSAELKEESKLILKEIYNKLDFSNIKELRVEGHTDSIPIVGMLKRKYPSNWELSTARASAIVRYLIKLGAPKHKLVAVGYADTRPIASNSTPEGRMKNRRVEFLIVSDEKEELR